MLVWLRKQSEEMLLGMKTRPFISYKRERQAEVAKLRDTLCIFGSGGWTDVEDLRLGTLTEDEIKETIRSDVGGFLWWGTRSALGSPTITKIEIPEALARADREPFPVVPVFVDLTPSRDRRAIRRAIERSADLLNFNGVLPVPNERPGLFRERVAKRYVADAIVARAEAPLRVAFRVHGPGDFSADLTCDWRSIFDAEARCFTRTGEQVAVEAIANIRESLQRRDHAPEVQIDSDLPLPLAYLIGYQWRETTRLRLSAIQRTRTSYRLTRLYGRERQTAQEIVHTFSRSGPVVVAAMCGDGMPKAALRYAVECGARELRVLHAPGMLSGEEIRGLAVSTASVLRELRDQGVEKHLLIFGPNALAMAVGTRSNAVGQVIVPFWHDVSSRYVNPIHAGASG